MSAMKLILLSVVLAASVPHILSVIFEFNKTFTTEAVRTAGKLTIFGDKLIRRPQTMDRRANRMRPTLPLHSMKSPRK